jgi:hypothetical protein
MESKSRKEKVNKKIHFGIQPLWWNVGQKIHVQVTLLLVLVPTP